MACGEAETGRRVLGFRVSPLSAAQIVDAALAGPRPGRPNLVITANTDHVAKLRRDAALAAAYRAAAVIVCDGWPVAAYARLRGHPVRRVTGYEIAALLMRQRPIPPVHRLFFVVDSAATEQAMHRWAERRGLAGQVAVAVPPMGFERDGAYCAELARTVREHAATLLVMGVGAPRSEVFVHRHAGMLPPCWALCVGQAVRVEAGLSSRAPRFMQRLNGEWLWRILLEPRRLLGRYVVSTAGFLRAVAADARGGAVLAGSAPARDAAPVGFVVSMFGQRGGGMGRIVEYLLASTQGRLAGLRLVRVDTRGQGRAHLSLHHLAAGVGQVWWAALAGRAALLHLNMAERGSIFRKGVMLLAAKPFGMRTVLHLHAAEIIPMFERIPGRRRFLVRRVFLAADRIIVLGEVWRQWLVSTVGVPADRIEVVHNGVPDFSGRHVPRAEGEPFRILFLGNLHARKGLADLLAGLALLAGEQAHWRLLIAGGGDDAPFRQQAERLGIAGRVAFLGWVDHARAQELLGGADALALPSYQEGLPLVILEALAAGVPVVTTPVGAIGEVLTDDATALIVRPGDTAALARAVGRLIAEPELRARLSSAARALFQERFSLEKFSERVGQVYQAVLAS